jgi:hypothetical protein
MRREAGAGNRPGRRPPRRRRGRKHPAIGILPWALLSAAAVIAALLAGASALIAGCVVVLACAAIVLGWQFGERGRVALEDEIEHRTTELKRALSELEIAQAETVQRLSMAVEFSDEDTGAHIERIGRFSVLLAEHIGMDAEFCERLKHAAPLHDVGKVAIPDAILLKPGPLTPEERAIVETHAEEGHRLVRGSSSSILDMAATIALSHQEKWDGTRLPARPEGRGDPDRGPDRGGGGRVRRAHQRPRLPQGVLGRGGRADDARTARAPLRPGAAGRVHGSPRPMSGPDAREQLRSDPIALVESTLETFATALERGDAEMAEGAIATAIEDGITPTTLHAEVIAPALRRISVLSEAGEIDADREHRAGTITRRVLATLYRYMTRQHRAHARARAAGGRGGRRAHARPADGPRPARGGGLPHDLRHRPVGERLLEMVDSQSPDVVVLGATAPTGRGVGRAGAARAALQSPGAADRAGRAGGRRQPAARTPRHARARAHRRVGGGGRGTRPLAGPSSVCSPAARRSVDRFPRMAPARS